MEQSTNYLPHILIGLGALILGWIIGFMDSNMRTGKKVKQAEASAEIAIQDAKDKTAQAEAKLASIAATPVTADDPGMLRIKNENGILALDLDGSRVNTTAMSPDQRKRLIEMLNVMRPWLEGKPASAPIPATPPRPTQPMPAPVNSTSPAPQPIAPKTTPAITPAPKKDDKPIAPLSMVGQINVILQANIANTKLAEIGITLLESSTGGVNVFVGLNKFEGIEAVPDDDIKAAIRTAIAEWERKYTPGLR